MKSKRIILMVSTFLIILLLAVPVSAASKTVNMKAIGFSYGTTTKTLKKIAGKIGKMKNKNSKKYTTFYWSGNKVTIGVCENAKAGKYNNEYIRVTNSGNKKFMFCKVKIGDKKSTVEKKLSKQYLRSYDNGKTYWYGDAAYIKFIYKKNKVKKWIYVIAPTSG